MEEIKNFQIGEFGGEGVDLSNSCVHELQVSVELVEELLVANKLGETICKQQLIQLRIILAPPFNHGQLYIEVLRV